MARVRLSVELRRIVSVRLRATSLGPVAPTSGSWLICPPVVALGAVAIPEPDVVVATGVARLTIQLSRTPELVRAVPTSIDPGRPLALLLSAVPALRGPSWRPVVLTRRTLLVCSEVGQASQVRGVVITLGLLVLHPLQTADPAEESWKSQASAYALPKPAGKGWRGRFGHPARAWYKHRYKAGLERPVMSGSALLFAANPGASLGGEWIHART